MVKYLHIQLFIIFIWAPLGISAQSYSLSGTVIDSITKEPLAFVNISNHETGKGTVSSIDGKFRVSFQKRPGNITFSYVGYLQKSISTASYKPGGEIVVKLTPTRYDINEVVIIPGVNPAHRIIKLASDNRKINHPEKIGSFSYISYDKMIFTTDMDSLARSKTRKKRKRNDKNIAGLSEEDSTDESARKFLTNNYLLMMESISSRKFIYPDKNKEDILASRVSGLKQPSFLVMARQFQSFSFYDDFITIASKKYLNPLSQGSTGKYFFLLEDTFYTGRNDTVFIISFRPKKGKNFDGLKGVLYINSYKWAVQNVIAEAYQQQNELVSVKIQQKYDLINGQQWFPSQLNTNLIFNNIEAETNTRSMKVIGIGKSYLVNIQLNPELDKKDFDNTFIDVNKAAHLMPEEFWQRYRVDPLTPKEIETYRVIDSIGQANNFDMTVNSIESLLTGYLPGRYIDVNLRSLVDYNSYEGWRLGFGGRTNKNLSPYFDVGGHVAYGIKDKQWKYGAFITFNLDKRHDFNMRVSYLDDLEESGGIKFLEQISFLSSESFRKYMVENMDVVLKKQVELNWIMLKYLRANLFFRTTNIEATNSYLFSLSDISPVIMLNRFDYTELGFRLRYAYGEGFMETPYGNKFSLGTKYPIVYLNVTRGFHWLNGDFDFTRVESKISKTFTNRILGDSKILLTGGLVIGNVPYSKLYAGQGSYKKIGVETENSFSTMQFDEFLSDKFISFYFKQDFGKLLFRTKKFSPGIALVNNIGFGWLDDKEYHTNIEFQTMDKGYYECGILFNNLLRYKFFGYGLGLYYRYGPYSFSSIHDNFAFKLSFVFNL